MYKIKLEQFEGPLDLLLQLIENEKLNVNQISLAKAADQYIEYVNSQKNIPLEDLSDFLLVASKLLYIKSKSLLPYLVWNEAEEEATDLEEQLKLYKEFLDASRKIDALARQKQFLFSRERIALPKGFYPPPKLKVEKLKEVYKEILGRIEPLIKTGKEIREKAISIKQKIEDLKLKISRRANLGFKEFVGKAKNKTEVVVSFLALLELIKQRTVGVSQKKLFEDIIIEKR